MGDKNLPPPRPPPRRNSNNAGGRPPPPPSNMGTESPTLSRSTIPQDRRPKSKASFRSSIVALPDPEMMQLETEDVRLSHATMKVDYQDILQRHSPTGSPEQNMTSSTLSGESQQQATILPVDQDEDDKAGDTTTGDANVASADDNIPVSTISTTTNVEDQGAAVAEEDIFMDTDDSGVGPLEIQEEIRRTSLKASMYGKDSKTSKKEEKSRSVHFAENPVDPVEEGVSMSNQDLMPVSDNEYNKSTEASDTTDIDDAAAVTAQSNTSVIHTDTVENNENSNVYETTTNTNSSINSENINTSSIISSDGEEMNNKRRSTNNSSRNRSLDMAELISSLEAILVKWTGAVSRAAEKGVNKNIVTFAASSISKLSPNDTQIPNLVSQESVEENKANDSGETDSADVVNMKEASKAYEQKIAMLQESISDERTANAESRRIFEETLSLKYEALVDQLNTKVAQDHEVRMKRAVEEIRRRNMNDSEKIIKMHELSKSAEDQINRKFKDIVTELHNSWESETKAHTKAIEERNRSHFKAVLNHMEKQLKTSLSLQNEVDTRWLEELDRRSQNQAETLFAFEEKCKQLYDERYKRVSSAAMILCILPSSSFHYHSY